jgi:hypothetical protein
MTAITSQFDFRSGRVFEAWQKTGFAVALMLSLAGFCNAGPMTYDEYIGKSFTFGGFTFSDFKPIEVKGMGVGPKIEDKDISVTQLANGLQFDFFLKVFTASLGTPQDYSFSLTYKVTAAKGGIGGAGLSFKAILSEHTQGTSATVNEKLPAPELDVFKNAGGERLAQFVALPDMPPDVTVTDTAEVSTQRTNENTSAEIMEFTNTFGVPEPATWSLLVTGAALIISVRKSTFVRI